MRSKVTLSFDVPLPSLGDAVAAITELIGIPTQDIRMHDARETQGAVAEIAPASSVQRRKYTRRAMPIAAIVEKKEKRSRTARSYGRAGSHVSFALGDIENKQPIFGGSSAPRNTRYCRLTTLLKARGMKDLPPHDTEFDTVICPSTSDGIEKIFRGKHAWNGIRGRDKNMKQLKYIAMYESSQGGGRGAVVAYAPILGYKRR